VFVSGFPNCIHENQQMCDMCGRKFKAKKDVWMHKLAKHGVLAQECDLPVFSCTECSKRFLRQDFYERHLRTHPSEPKPHACDECSHRAATWSALVIHKRRRHRPASENDNNDNEDGAGSQGAAPFPPSSEQGGEQRSVDRQDTEQCAVDTHDGLNSEHGGDDSSGQ
jgi:DNA-directed RNA polymerase subunit RPC12/RpoP